MAQGTLEIRLLGGLDLRLGGVPLPPMEWARAESLLAYLVLHAGVQLLRQRLAFLLWPDTSEQQARTNLRHALHTLRRSLPDPDRYLDVTPRALLWRPDARWRLDVADFEESLRAADASSGAERVAALREAVAGYTGDLLDGLDDGWLQAERERLRQRHLEALEALANLLEASGDQAAAIRHAEQLLAAQPVQEETYRLLMRLHQARGDRARALRTYHECTSVLQQELGVEPSAPTRALYDALLRPAPVPAAAEPPPQRLRGAPLVGRSSELADLRELWHAAERGHPHLALITGEAGIGKTRLVEELTGWCSRRGALVVNARSYHAEGAPAYAPIVAWLRSDGLKERLDRLADPLRAQLARLLPELQPTLSDLFLQPLSEDDQRQLLFDAVAQALLAPGRALLLCADDLHWADAPTLSVLHYLLRVEPPLPLLVTATVRLDEVDDEHPLVDLTAGLYALDRCTELQLGRLSAADTAALAAHLAASQLNQTDAEGLFATTEGNPLFVVETLRAGWRPGQPLPEGVSRRVQTTIATRLAQLSPSARQLMGVAATIGRAFSTETLARASEADEATLMRGLDELWRRGIVRAHGADGYDFSHDTIRHTAYRALSPALRRRHHRAVAHALEANHPDDAEPVSSQIAIHLESAGAIDEAVAWYGRAAEAALQVHAHAEAARLLERGLDRLRAQPATMPRQAQELDQLSALLAALTPVEGMASERVTQAQQRALELARILDVDPAPPVLRSIALARLARDDFAAAQDVGRQLVARGGQEGDNVLVVEGEYILGVSAFWRGDLASARTHLQLAVRRYDRERRFDHLVRYGQDPKATCLMRLALTLSLQGRPAAARRARATALEWVDAIDHHYTTMVAHVFAAYLAIELREHDAVREHARLLAATAARDRNRAPQIEIIVDVLDGLMMVLDGRSGEGIARITAAWDDPPKSAAVAPGVQACIGRVLLEACARAGDAQAGLEASARALQRQGTARLWQSEFHRLRAEFLAALGASTTTVRDELELALGGAGQQGARALELRAATTLLQQVTERGEAAAIGRARERLTAVVVAYPERDGSAELDAAAALLGRQPV